MPAALPAPSASGALRSRSTGLLVLLVATVATAHAALLMQLVTGQPLAVAVPTNAMQVRLVAGAAAAPAPISTRIATRIATLTTDRIAGQTTDPVTTPPRSPASRPGRPPSPTPPTAPAAPTADGNPLAGFWPADQLDRRALPVAAPETSMLDGAQLSGLPLRLRLFIDAQGRVVAVQPQHITPDDEAALPRLRAMFCATAFVPGRLQGRDVPSFTDIELGLETIEPQRLN
jgi:hypothetical protein